MLVWEFNWGERGAGDTGAGGSNRQRGRLEVALDGKPDQAGNAVDLKFAHNIRAIGIDRFRTYF
jgi:hypothetical protein